MPKRNELIVYLRKIKRAKIVEFLPGHTLNKGEKGKVYMQMVASKMAHPVQHAAQCDTLATMAAYPAAPKLTEDKPGDLTAAAAMALRGGELPAWATAWVGGLGPAPLGLLTAPLPQRGSKEWVEELVAMQQRFCLLCHANGNPNATCVPWVEQAWGAIPRPVLERRDARLRATAAQIRRRKNENPGAQELLDRETASAAIPGANLL